MKIKTAICLPFVLCLTTGRLALPQLKPDEIAQRESWEQFLLSADIIKADALGEGVTKPLKMTLRKGEVEHFAVWKNLSAGLPNGERDDWRYEIAAYRLDKLLGLQMVPVAVERTYKRKKGMLSLWMESKTNMLKMAQSGESFPPAALAHSDKMKFITRLWDSLIANEDRTLQNIMVTEDWRVILIDHSRAFRASEMFTKNLIFGMNGLQKLPDGRGLLFKPVPRALVEKIRALDAASIMAAVGPYLTRAEIEAILARKRLILDELEKLIAQDGEAKVLYD
ncbi:MAG: hypothetical protein JW843_00730 [Candidatus Aminicenantes bacterium]|nr:hypothetical protein [Candidatus Aminicenantes bacterium]